MLALSNFYIKLLTIYFQYQLIVIQINAWFDSRPPHHKTLTIYLKQSVIGSNPIVTSVM